MESRVRLFCGMCAREKKERRSARDAVTKSIPHTFEVLSEPATHKPMTVTVSPSKGG